MAHDGTEGLSPDGWLPDRVSVGVLTKVFPPELVDRVVDDTDTRELRRRLLPSRLVVYFVLALWLFRGRNCGYARVMSKLVDGLYHRRQAEALLAGLEVAPGGPVDAGEGKAWRIPNISSLSRARARVGADPLHMLFDAVAGPVGAADAPGVFVCGLRVISTDGSTTDVPATEENDAAFGRPSTAGRAGAFPQVRWLVAAESGTGALVGATVGAYTVGEQTLLADLLPAFGPGMLILADRNFLGHRQARDVLATGAHILWRASASFALTPIRVLDDGTHLAEWKPACKADGPPITVRVIEYTVHTTTVGADGACESVSEVFCLVTDLLDVAEYPALDLACAYPKRWGCETVIGHHKTDMGEGQAVLRSGDPEGVAQEMWALFAVYQAICRLTGAAADADAAGIPPEQISFPNALAAAASSVAAFPPHRLDLALATFLLKVLQPRALVRDRPDRSSPRRTKKAGDFPARRPGEPSVVTVTRRIELHCLGRPRSP